MDELDAFLTTLERTSPDAPTRCPGWTAHDLLAHLVAGTEEMLRLTTLAGRGETSERTRPFSVREAPWRRVADRELRVVFLEVGARLMAELDALPTGTRVPFTGWAMTAEELRTHGRSELAIHRWDLVGDDEVSQRLLGQRDLLKHGRMTLARMPTLPEARRTIQPSDDLLTMWGRTSSVGGSALIETERE
jgi:uncharacterized protein (TIGR03083 family)